MLLAQSLFYSVFEDGSGSSPNYSWAILERKDSVQRIVVVSNLGGQAVIERQNGNEQFFQLWQSEIIPGFGHFVVANIVGKVINGQGDCIYITHDCKQNTFVTKFGNVKTLIRGRPINCELLGIDLSKFNQESAA